MATWLLLAFGWCNCQNYCVSYNQILLKIKYSSWLARYTGGESAGCCVPVCLLVLFNVVETGSSKLTISAPAAVIHFFGRKANIADVHAGLVLQRHAPFVFHFDNIALINPPDSKAISTLLDLIISPEVLTVCHPTAVGWTHIRLSFIAVVRLISQSSNHSNVLKVYYMQVSNSLLFMLLIKRDCSKKHYTGRQWRRVSVLLTVDCHRTLWLLCSVGLHDAVCYVFVCVYICVCVCVRMCLSQTVKKLMIKNKRVFQPDHISYMVSSMSVTLKRFTGLHGFFTKLSSLVGYGPQNFELTDEHRQSISEVFASWPHLARLNYNDQPIDLPGSFDAMITPIVSHLTKLSLVRASVCLSVFLSLTRIFNRRDVNTDRCHAYCPITFTVTTHHFSQTTQFAHSIFGTSEKCSTL